MNGTKTTPSEHDLKIVKAAVKQAMSGGHRQVYQWAGLGYREHWADSITLSLIVAREGAVSTEWAHEMPKITKVTRS